MSTTTADPRPLHGALSATQIAHALGAPAPTPEQVAVIEAPLESMLVVAGAGSGKTETMASRVLWLIANGRVQAHEVLGLTFTRKASIELATRLNDKIRALRLSGLIEPLVPHGSPASDAGVRPDGALRQLQSPTVSTYHAYAGRLVAEHGLRIGVEPHARLLSEAACWQLAHEVVHSWTGAMDGLELAESTVVRAVLDLSSALSEHLVEPAEVRDWLSARVAELELLPPEPGKTSRTAASSLATVLSTKALIPALVEAYQQAKQDRSAMDFGDQVGLAARLARDQTPVGAGERSRYAAVLLDEFQDTSEAQMVLLSSLFAPRPAEGAAEGDAAGGSTMVPVVAVGDPNQSIYGWRGASATTLNRFPKRFGTTPQTPTPVRSLSMSWRNSRSVLDAANMVAEPLRRHSATPVRALRAAPQAPRGRVDLLRSATHDDQANDVARWVARRWFEPTGEWSGVTAAVLCRNRSQFDPVASALRREGLPVEIVGLGGLLNAPELLDLVSLLWVVQEPSRGDAVMRLLAGPVCRLGAADVSALWSWARHLVADYPKEQASLGEAIDRLPERGWVGSGGVGLSVTAHRRLTTLSAVITRLRSLVGLPLPDLLVEAERGLGLDIEVAADPDVAPGWSRAHLDALVDVASAFAASADRPTLGGFLSWLDAARDHERALEDVEIPELAEVSVQTGAVQVMTVHAAKGLEWDVVAVPGLAEGIFPALPGRAIFDPVPAELPTEDGTEAGQEQGLGLGLGLGVTGEAAEDRAWSYRPHAVNGWLTGVGALPYSLRGDRDGLPELDLSDQPDVGALKSARDDFAAAGIEHRVREERRLAYVALTRARREMALSAPVWSTGKRPRVTSRFLLELTRAHAERPIPGLNRGSWVAMPVDEGAENPLTAQTERADWPAVPGARRAAMTDLVETVIAARSTSPHAGGPPVGAARTRDHRDEVIAMLLAERDERDRLGGRVRSVEVPHRVSTSALLELSADPQRFVRRLRRPMPAPPSPSAEMGTRFHAWVEQHYRAPVLVDWEAVDVDPASWSPSADIEQMQQRFLASEWATRRPVALELAVTTTLAGRTVSGRIDAVFPRPDGGFTVVDWKTGRPGSEGEQQRRRLQLAVYRLAYARWRGVGIAEVDAAFFYASTGQTVRPTLPDSEDLEAQLETTLAEVGEV
ncbi:MAG: ATP-dependent DNA helicase [Ornithinimicrobium sp.]